MFWVTFWYEYYNSRVNCLLLPSTTPSDKVRICYSFTLTYTTFWQYKLRGAACWKNDLNYMLLWVATEHARWAVAEMRFRIPIIDVVGLDHYFGHNVWFQNWFISLFLSLSLSLSLSVVVCVCLCVSLSLSLSLSVVECVSLSLSVGKRSKLKVVLGNR